MTKQDKPATKPAKAAGKPAVKAAIKPGANAAVKPAAKAATKQAAKAATKPAAKFAAKPAARPALHAEAGTVPKLTVNPFLDADTHARMRDYTDAGAVVAKELRAIVECGAGSKCQEPRLAPSLASIRGVVKKGVSLGKMFDSIAAGTEKGLWEAWLATFGFELRTVNYAATGARNACLALDLRQGAKAHAIFASVGVQNWRSLVADDCAGVQVQNANDKTPHVAYAFFYLDRAGK